MDNNNRDNYDLKISPAVRIQTRQQWHNASGGGRGNIQPLTLTPVVTSRRGPIISQRVISCYRGPATVSMSQHIRRRNINQYERGEIFLNQDRGPVLIILMCWLRAHWSRCPGKGVRLAPVTLSHHTWQVTRGRMSAPIPRHVTNSNNRKLIREINWWAHTHSLLSLYISTIKCHSSFHWLNAYQRYEYPSIPATYAKVTEKTLSKRFQRFI